MFQGLVLVQFQSGGLNFFESSCTYGRIFVKSIQTRPRFDLNLFGIEFRQLPVQLPVQACVLHSD